MSNSVKHLHEELCNIIDNQPVFPGDVISHSTAYELERRGLIRRNKSGDWVTDMTYRKMLDNILNWEDGE